MPITFEFSEDIERKIFRQLDFALVRTYTKAAQVAQKAVREALPQRFTLRNNFVLNSIRIEPASKNKPVATVFVPTDGQYNADFLIRQELGGTKVPTRGRKNLTIPTSDVVSKSGIVTKRKRESILKDKEAAKKRGIFRIDEKTKDRYRKGRGAAGKALHPGLFLRRGGKLVRLFVFDKSAPVKPAFRFQDTAMRAAQDALPGLFAESLNEALRTAR